MFQCTTNKTSEKKRKKKEQSVTSKNKIPRNKLSQGGERFVHWELQNITERD